jgi:hypothetical protein
VLLVLVPTIGRRVHIYRWTNRGKASRMKGIIAHLGLRGLRLWCQLPITNLTILYKERAIFCIAPLHPPNKSGFMGPLATPGQPGDRGLYRAPLVRVSRIGHRSSARQTIKGEAHHLVARNLEGWFPSRGCLE